jgi:imidazolonepropionase-like amidohydrolase
MAVAFGLDPDTAIRSVTVSAAEILGVSSRLGSLESRKAATLMITDGDMLEVTTHVEQAWIDGREIDLSNKQTKLAEKYREKYKQQATTGAGKGGPKDAKGP